VVDPRRCTQTEINEVGPSVTPGELDGLRRKVELLLQEESFDFLVLSGSTPPGTPNDIYADLIEIGHRHAVRAVLDASGEPLLLGLTAKPWMVKPNIHELSALVGAQPAKDSDIIDAARELQQSGPAVVCVTQGSESVFCIASEGSWRAAPPRVEFVSAVGSGDAFLGAFLRAAELGKPISNCLEWGCGAGSANAAEYGAGFCSEEAIRRLAGETVVTKV
jgi:1-phosphofructokinase family hexose kinase